MPLLSGLYLSKLRLRQGGVAMEFTHFNENGEAVMVDVADRLLVRRAGRKAKHIFGRNTQFGRDRTFRGCAIDRHSHFPAARAQQQIKKRKRDCSEHRNRFFRTVCRPCGRQTVGKKVSQAPRSICCVTGDSQSATVIVRPTSEPTRPVIAASMR